MPRDAKSADTSTTVRKRLTVICAAKASNATINDKHVALKSKHAMPCFACIFNSLATNTAVHGIACSGTPQAATSASTSFRLKPAFANAAKTACAAKVDCFSFCAKWRLRTPPIFSTEPAGKLSFLSMDVASTASGKAVAILRIFIGSILF